MTTKSLSEQWTRVLERAFYPTVFFVVILGFCLTLLALLGPLILNMRGYGVSVEQIARLWQAAASACLLVVAALTASVAISQLQETKRSNQLRAFNDLISYFSDPAHREDRGWVYRNAWRLQPAELMADEKRRKKADHTLKTFQTAAHFIGEGLISEEFAVHLYGHPLVQAWAALAEYVKYHREGRDRQGFLRDLEEQAKRLAVDNKDIAEEFSEGHDVCIHLGDHEKRYFCIWERCVSARPEPGKCSCREEAETDS